jgi:hypothetical protein
MFINMGLSFFVLLFFVVSCGGKQAKKIHYGQTTEATLLEIEGQPKSEQELKYADGKMLIFDEEKKYQVESGVVVGSFQEPEGDQRNLLFWKHKFKDCQTTDLKTSPNSDGKERTLKCDEQGTSIVYSEGTGYVIRVVEHEKK